MGSACIAAKTGEDTFLVSEKMGKGVFLGTEKWVEYIFSSGKTGMALCLPKIT